MSLKKNPFEVFGLTPEMAHRLGEKDLFKLVKALHRSLQKMYHPDLASHRGRKSTKEHTELAMELNLAFEELNYDKDKESFCHYHKLYASRRNKGLRKKISLLEDGIKEIEEDKAELADSFIDHILHGLAWNRTDNWSGELVKTLTLPNPINMCLGLNDVAINHNLKSCALDIGSNYKEISFDSQGLMTYRPVGRLKAQQVNYIHLLGTIGVEDIELIPLLKAPRPKKNRFKGPALDSRYGIDGPSTEVTNSLTLEKFKNHCLHLLNPEIKERAYLFSLQRPVFEAALQISLEGVVVKITRT